MQLVERKFKVIENSGRN